MYVAEGIGHLIEVVAILPHSSFRVTVQQGVMFGGAEEYIVERSDCHNDEVGVKKVKEVGQHDMADQVKMTGFLQHL